MLVDRVIVGSMYTNAYIVSTGKKECVVLDPGADGPALVQRLEAMNLTPKAILLTHGHLDHTSAAGYVVDHYRNRGHHVPVGIHESDAALIGDGAHNSNEEIFAAFGDAGKRAFETFESSVPRPEFFLNDGQAILDSDLVAMHTPGHSDGSVCIYSEARQAVFSGDTLFFNNLGRGDVKDGNHEQIRRAVTERLFELPSETRVFPGHGPVTTIEREIDHNTLDSEGATI